MVASPEAEAIASVAQMHEEAKHAMTAFHEGDSQELERSLHAITRISRRAFATLRGLVVIDPAPASTDLNHPEQTQTPRISKIAEK